MLFRSSAGLVFTRVFGEPNVLAVFESLAWPARLLLPAVGGGLAASAGALVTRAEGARGVGDVMEAVVLGRTRISLKLASAKALGSWIAIVSGGSVGREGAIIRFGGGLGATVGRAFGLREHGIRALVAAGTAAGFAAAYNTPFAAVLFVVEIVSGVVALDFLIPTLIATPIATAVARLVLGGGPIYGARSFTMASELELGCHVGLGLLAGVVGPAFVAMLHRGEELFAKLPLSRPLCGALGGLLVGVLALALPQVAGNGYESINLILGGGIGMTVLLLLLGAKAVATTSSVGSGSPGGVFTPALFIGAALGAAFGRALALAFPGAVGASGGYALVGMAALTAATTHAPLLGAVLVFELSGDYAIALPLLIATATATLVSRMLRPNSIYMEELARRGNAWDITLEGRRMRS